MLRFSICHNVSRLFLFLVSRQMFLFSYSFIQKREKIRSFSVVVGVIASLYKRLGRCLVVVVAFAASQCGTWFPSTIGPAESLSRVCLWRRKGDAYR